MICYFKIKDIIYSSEVVAKIDCSEIEDLKVKLHLISGDILTIEGLDAIDAVMQAKPSIIEGKRFDFKKGAWVIHNLIGHPLMQILALIHLFKLSIWIHEITIPRPRGKYEKD